MKVIIPKYTAQSSVFLIKRGKSVCFNYQFDSISLYMYDIVHIIAAVDNGHLWSEIDRFRGPLRESFGGHFCDHWITIRGFCRRVLRSASIKCDPQSSSKIGPQSGPKSVIFREPASDYSTEARSSVSLNEADMPTSANRRPEPAPPSDPLSRYRLFIVFIGR